ncbi:MAG: hypothetical protein AVDCRST_MAG08-3246 [uncultured Acetobacteraceae bacterium]|uniref:DUF4440 domain-containing protein n=1 Tax=uncultured Acetobacteraceae bacterium TaxID=169975 RepID=A0A6J4J6U7_9PROT|nr:MAG: hypothetical protein AVDCRST_MAG08-3246 [uncultured Acetobacteraceae bacterium]
MTDEDAWRLEERFWTGGEDHHREALDPECVMAFPPPAGIVQGPDIAQSLAGAPRWSSVTMTETHAGRPSGDLLVLAYKARGQRDGAAAYDAYCTSTYRSVGGGRWRLIQHQQTPA